MLSVRNLILCSLAVASFSALAGRAEQPVAGRHDGGGQGVKGPDGSIEIADRFPPRNAATVFQPTSEPVELLKDNKELSEQIDLIDKILNLYANSSRYSYAWVGKRIREKKYYLVDKLPDVPDCQAPRDNSGVPSNSEVFHIACTQDGLKDVTFLLSNDKFDFRKLPVERQADVLTHEAFRSWKVRLDTYSLEIIVNGLSRGRDIYVRQMAGERQPLSESDYQALQQMQREIPQTPLLENRQNRDDAVSIIVRNGGGLVYPYKSQKIDPSAFISVGSVVSMPVVIEKDVEIIRSGISGRSEYADVSPIVTLHAGVKLIDSTFYSAGAEVQSGVIIDGSEISAQSVIKVGANVELQKTKLASHKLSVGDNVKMIEADLQGPYTLAFENKVSISNSVVDYGATDKSDSFIERDEKTTEMTVRFGENAKLQDSVVQLTDSFSVGANADVRNLNLRVRPFIEDKDSKKPLPNLTIAANSQIVSDNRPVIFLGKRSMWSFSTPDLSLEGNVDFTKLNLCKGMGYSKASHKEIGIGFTGLKVTAKSDLSSCEETAPIAGRYCNNREGCDGYREAINFINAGEVAKLNDVLLGEVKCSTDGESTVAFKEYMSSNGFYRNHTTYKVDSETCKKIENFYEQNKEDRYKACAKNLADVELLSVPGKLGAVYQVKSIGNLRFETRCEYKPGRLL
jgi:hypothetical protein